MLVVAGDVEPDAVRALAEKTYGKVARGPDLPPRIRPVEPEQNTKRTVTLTDARVACRASTKCGWCRPISTARDRRGGGARSAVGNPRRRHPQPASTRNWWSRTASPSTPAPTSTARSSIDTNFTVYGAPRGDAKLDDVEAAVDAEIAKHRQGRRHRRRNWRRPRTVTCAR